MDNKDSQKKLLNRRSNKNNRVKFDDDTVIIDSVQKLDNPSTSPSLNEPNASLLSKLPFLGKPQPKPTATIDQDNIPAKNQINNKNSPGLPLIVKESINAKNLDSATLKLNKYLIHNEFFPLDQLLVVINKFIVEHKQIQEIIFDGLEVTTDLVFYIIYKHYKDTDVFKHLELVSLNGCRYVTDFGIWLLSHAANKPSLVNSNLCIGCHKIVKLRHHGAWIENEDPQGQNRYFLGI